MRFDVLDRLAEIPQAVRRAHDVGMHDQRHDPRRALSVRVQLVELIDGAVPVFRRLVVLD